ncbi:fungal-specific transcription factor domain-containing protein [Scheffersomyces amazonensis]|uniref:fungal-specific transcription factor domain-containing protein n=1 Tax=Scheffersomyces amazonensis TaxID=1078765 RepID=UPI00315C57ED
MAKVKKETTSKSSIEEETIPNDTASPKDADQVLSASSSKDSPITDETTPVPTPASTSTSTSSTNTNTHTKKSTAKNPDKPKAFTIKYKRPRGSRACTVCRSRKVRCDAEIHIPCTNCITFGCDCVLPEAKKRGNSSGDSKSKRKQTSSVSNYDNLNNNSKDSSENVESESTEPVSGTNSNEIPSSNSRSVIATISSNSVKTPQMVSPSITSTTTSTLPVNITKSLSGGGNGSNSSINEPMLNISQVSVPPSLSSSYKNRPSMHKRDLLASKQKTSLTFLGHSSIGLVPQKEGDNHIQLTEDVFETSDISLDSVELEILKLRGAFLLPSHELCLDLINSYFEHVHPLMPVINRTEFMKKFNDPNDNPSLMVLQAVLLSGCRVTNNPLLLDSKGSSNLAALTFFRRAKALYETNYESDPVSIIQTLILIGTYWEGPEDVTKNSFYWTRVAVGLAQGFGFQRDVNKSTTLTNNEKKIWRRIWWCLFEKDRNVAIAFGRPSVIDLNDCDVPMLTMEDFDENDSETDTVSPYPVDETQALYFIHLVKLAEITGIIIKHQYSVKSEQLKRKNKFSIIQHCDMLMGIWFTNLPPQLVFSLTDTTTQNFYSCLLNAQYYNRLYLIHRSNLIRMAKSSSANPNNYKYPSWGISFQSARMISIISKILLDRKQIKYCPVMFVYIAFSALVMLIYHVDSSNSVIASTAADSLMTSRAVLKELTNFFPIAKVLMKLFDKYANDKIKRARVIENGNRIAEYQELTANQKAARARAQSQTQTQIQAQVQAQANAQAQQQAQIFGNKPQPLFNQASPGNNSNSSGISPGGGVYARDFNQTTNTHQKQLNLEELVQQTKVKESNSAKHSDTSPSSTQSFPDVTLVTENLPTNQNFFENFEPSQLFPDVRYSYPPTRAQSPSAHLDLDHSYNQSQQSRTRHNDDQPMVGSNVYSSGLTTNSVKGNGNGNGNSNAHDVNTHTVGEEQYPPTTPGGTFNTNFIDSSFLNMNLQAGIESNSLNDDLSSLFNLQY